MQPTLEKPINTPTRAEVHQPSLWSITLSHATVDLQTGALPIMLPALLTSLSINYSLATGIIFANQIIIAIAQPLFGILGDKRSFKLLVPLGCALTAAGMALVLWMPSYPLVILAVLISGLGSAAFHPEALSRVRAISGDKPTTGTSVFFAGGNIGFGLAPLLTAFLSGLGKPFLLVLALPTVLGLGLLASQWKTIVSGTSSAKKAGSSGGKILWGFVAFLGLLITLRGTVLGGLTTFIPLYFHENGQLSKTAAATLVTIASLAGIAGTLLGASIANRIGRKAMMLISALIVMLAMLGFLHTSGLVQMILIGLVGLCSSAAWPTIVIMIQESMPGYVGLASGLSLGTVYAATGIGVALLGILADHVGLASTLELVTFLPIGIVALTALLPNSRKV